MPLVRIDLVEGRRTDEQLRTLADAVQDSIEAVFAAPPGDRYQIIHEHKPGRMFIEDTGLGLARTDDVVVVHVLQQGRSEEQRRSLYAELADQLQQRTGLDPMDLVVAVSANTKADWSFGLGRAQFLDGDL